MNKSRTRYIMTWGALALLLLGGTGLLMLSWNGIIRGKANPTFLTLCWLLSAASGIYLFMMAVKRTHRQLKLDEQKQKNQARKSERKSRGIDEKDKLDVAAMARKIARRMPDTGNMKDAGKDLMKILARELEIMSAVLYCREEMEFVEVANYALSSPTGPLSFKDGEDLPGQAARNGQIMVLTQLPEEYMEVFSGLGKAEPAYLAIVPFTQKNRTVAVLECAGYKYDPADIESMFRILVREMEAKFKSDTGK